jgi:fibronectin type 3 domain-containing protein
MANLNEQIKKVAMDAFNQSEPATFIYGTVTSASPLTIQVEQKLSLTKEFLVLTKNVIDYEAEVEVDWKTDDATHTIKGIKKMKMKNGLKVADKVILVKQQGGQKYLVLDKIMS